ncbi:hypothetical protein GCM10022252_72500 [Streptosporangium oxazolinicum]|uniref:DUF7927 domain-containing protein n=1 Tax=Streptosporangium oxazolinicum TaxID=909287 RepID=A0ABP8BJ17_9ACTN
MASPASETGKRVARGASGGENRAAEVEITKTASPVLAKPGQKVTYTVELRNTGDIAYQGFAFTDDLSGLLDDADFDHDLSATSGTVVFAESEVIWTGDVAAGQTVTVTYGVTVNDPPAGDLRLSGKLVGPQGSNCEAGSTDAACGNLGGPGLPLLYVLLTADRETAGPGQRVGYTITVGNVGNADYPGATLTGELSRVLDDAAYNGDARVTKGAVSYGAPKLAWAGDVSVGETVTITYSVTVGTSATGDGVLDSAVQAVGGGTNCPDPAPWSARRAAPVPGAGLGCAQRVAVQGATATGTITPEDSEPDDGAGARPGSDCPAGSAEPGCGTESVKTATGPAPVSGAADGSAQASSPASAPGSGAGSASDSGSGPGSVPGSAPDPGSGSDSGSGPEGAPVPDPDSGPIPAPGSVPSPVPDPARASVSPSGAAPVPGPERAPVPARVPKSLSDPSCVPGRGRSVSIPCFAGGSRKVPAGPSLPFTGVPVGLVLVGLLLSGLGLVLRLSARPRRL